MVVAQITYQSLFKLYPKLSGMTGTAKTEVKKFDRNLKVSAVLLDGCRFLTSESLLQMQIFRRENS